MNSIRAPEQHAEYKRCVDEAFGKHKRLGPIDWTQAPIGTIGAIVKRDNSWHLFTDNYEPVNTIVGLHRVVMLDGVEVRFNDTTRWVYPPKGAQFNG